MDETNLPRWVAEHKEFYGSKISIAQYRKFDEILCSEMGATGDLLLSAVEEMIRSCFVGWQEAHLKFLQNYVAKNAPACDVCRGRGVVEVPNRGPRSKVYPRIGFLCFCAVGIRARGRYPDAATIGDYETRYGKGWRAELPADTVLASTDIKVEAGDMGPTFRRILERLKGGVLTNEPVGWNSAFAGSDAVADARAHPVGA